MLFLLAPLAVSFSAAPMARTAAAHTLHRNVRTHPNMAADAVPAAPAPDGFEWADAAAAGTTDVRGMVQPVPAPRTLSLEQELEELYDTLELYDLRVVALEEQVEAAKNDAEVSVQRTGAFWIERLAQVTHPDGAGPDKEEL